MRQYRNRRWRGQASFRASTHMPRVLRRNGRNHLDLRVVYAESCGILGPGVTLAGILVADLFGCVEEYKHPCFHACPDHAPCLPEIGYIQVLPIGEELPEPYGSKLRTAKLSPPWHLLHRERQQRGELSCPCISWLNQGRNRSLTCKDPGLEKRTP